MTESYDPYEHAVAERVNGILKQEFIDTVKVEQLDIMEKLVSESINIYNTKRPHFSCNMLTPRKMHQQNKIKHITY